MLLLALLLSALAGTAVLSDTGAGTDSESDDTPTDPTQPQGPSEPVSTPPAVEPDTPPPTTSGGQDAGNTDVTEAGILSWSPTGTVVQTEHFGANTIYSVNTNDGTPSETFGQATEALDIDHLRFPAGQGDGNPDDIDGVDWLNVVAMDTAPDGTPQLREELTNFLDWAQNGGDAQDGEPIKVTLVIPTKFLSVEAYDAFGEDTARFAETALQNYSDTIEAFEIGNEYWAMGETAYAAKANVAAQALADGMAKAGIAEDAQPSILVQMATPNAGSEFHDDVDNRNFTERLVLANQKIIDGLGPEARDAIDGVVEHYYYRTLEQTFVDDPSAKSFINRDFAVWQEAFEKELDLHITEWNIRLRAIEENGLRAASVYLEQFENMLEMGVDSAHIWAVQHNTTTDLAGSPNDAPILGDGDQVLNTIRGAMFDMMSTELVGMELLTTEISGDDGSFEIDVYHAEDRLVVYAASRSLEEITLEVDLSTLIASFEEAGGQVLGINTDARGADGTHYVPGEGRQDADSVMINGSPHFFNEHDVQAELTAFDVDSTTVQVTLKPFEVAQVIFNGTNEPLETPATLAVAEEGTGMSDRLIGRDGNDTLAGGGGNDFLHGKNGNDHLSGDAGDDYLIGGRGADSLYGGDGADALSGWAGDDSLKGNWGDDTLSGHNGEDTLAGSVGNDLLRGGNGDDLLQGGRGQDTLLGGAGEDTLIGWSGEDVFRIGDAPEGAVDVIMDFAPGKDMLEIDSDLAQSLADVTFEVSDTPSGITLLLRGEPRALLIGDLDILDIATPASIRFT